MKKCLIPYLLIASIVCSCHREVLAPEPEGMFYATFDEEIQTKTALEGNSIIWTAGDQINVITSSDNEQFSLVSGAGTQTAGFSGNKVSGNEYYALYPYDENAYLQDGRIITTFPSNQVAKANGIGNGMNMSIAKSSSSSLQFKNVGGLVKFQITTENVAEVVIAGNNNEVLAGTVSIDWNGGIPSFIMGAEQYKQISVKPSTPNTAFAPGVYYAIVLPCNFSNGITVTFKPLVGSTGNGVRYCNVPADLVKTGASAMNLQRARIKVVGDIDGGRLWSFSNVEMNAIRGKTNNKGTYIDLRNGRTFSPINAYRHGGDIQMCLVQSNVRALGIVSCTGANIISFVNAINLEKFNDIYQTASDADLVQNWPAKGDCSFYWLDSSEMNDEIYNSLTLTADVMNLCTGTFLKTTIKDLGSSGTTTDLYQMTQADINNGTKKFLLVVTKNGASDDYYGIIRFNTYQNDPNYPKVWFDYKIGRAPNPNPIVTEPEGPSYELDNVPISEVLGCTTCAGQYALTEDPCLIEGAKKLQALGTKTIKLWFEHAGQQYPYNSSWPEDIENYSSLQLAKTPYFQEVFNMPFKTYSLEYNDAKINWRDGLSETEKISVYNNLYSLAVHLLKTYKNSGKTFIIQNWEGDGHLNISGLTEAQRPIAIQGMIDWANTRQAAITKARKDVGCEGVLVAHAFEFNYVLITNMPEPFVINCVVPYTHCDLYSYSSYSSGRAESNLDEIYDRIAHIRTRTPASKLYGQHNLMIGEFGFDERRLPGHGYVVTVGPESDAFQKMMVQGQLERLLDLNLTYIFYWQLYCNGALDDYGYSISTRPDPEHMLDNSHCKGFWLIRADGSLTGTYNYFKDLFDVNANVLAKRPVY